MPEPRFPNDKGRPIPVATQHLVHERDGSVCQYCGVSDSLSYDHVYPWSQGGTHDARNLVLCCEVDNSIAGSRVFSEFAAKKKYVLARRQQLGREGIANLTVTLKAYGAAAVRDLESATPENPERIANPDRKG